MKILFVIFVLLIITCVQSQQGFDEIKSWRERLQFKEDYERLQEMIQQVDHIIAYLDTDQGKNLTPKQYEELLNEITSIEQEISSITSSYKDDSSDSDDSSDDL